MTHNSTYLFTVHQSFRISGRGLVLTSETSHQFTKTGSKVRLVRPDQSTLETVIKGVTFEGNQDILVGDEIKKEDVPEGTEVWLI